MKNILITGGAGYIGSHTVVELLKNKEYNVIILDNFSNSKKEIIERIKKISNRDFELYSDDCCVNIEHIFTKHKIDSVIHFAASKSVGESVKNPLSYFRNNINSLINVLECCNKYGVESIIFSSSCSLYGNLNELPAHENSKMSEPESPYAYTKLVGERILRDSSNISELKSIALRYFNPVGAHESGLIGESPLNKPNNIIPVICNSIENGEILKIWGNDYNTADGTCIRDYVHVCDIANAHVLAFEYSLSTNKKFDVFNLGFGNGISVLDIVNTFEKSNQIKINFEFADRREGDVEKIYSDSSKAKKILGWSPTKTREDMVTSAWKWNKNKI